jgi:hypothetical protein
MSGEGKIREGMPTRRTGGIPRSPPEKIEEEPPEAGPSISVPIPPSPFSAMGIKKEPRTTFFREDIAEIPEELKPRSEEEEALHTKIKEEMTRDILGLNQWMTDQNLKFDLEKNDQGEWNDEGDVQTEHIFEILEAQAKQIKGLEVMIEHIVGRLEKDKRETDFDLEEARDKQGELQVKLEELEAGDPTTRTRGRSQSRITMTQGEKKGPKVDMIDFTGKPGADARNWLEIADTYRLFKKHLFNDDQEFIIFALTKIIDKAAPWASNKRRMITDGSTKKVVHDWAAFKKEFREAYFDHNEYNKASRDIKTLYQTGSCSMYTIAFQNYIDILGWTDDKQIMVLYHEGLKGPVKDLMVSMKEPDTFSEMKTIAMKADNRLWDRKQEKDKEVPKPKPKIPASSGSAGHPITINAATVNPGSPPMYRAKITQEERLNRIRNKLCLYCGKSGHIKDAHKGTGANGEVVWNPVINNMETEGESVKDDSS